MKLIKQDDYYIAQCPFSEKDLAKRAGFTWNKPLPHCWATASKSVAAKLIHYATPEVRAELESEVAKRAVAITESRADSADIEIPHNEGMDYLPFQRAAVAYAIKRPACLLADEMGVGKTVEAIGVANYFGDFQYILVVSPATLKLNWRNELRKWLVQKLDIGVASSDKPWPPTPIVVINYDILQTTCQFCKKKKGEPYEDSEKRKKDCPHCQGTQSTIKFPELYTTPWDLVIADEMHYVKGKSRRAKAMAKINGRFKLALTGTPILSRPIEAFNILNWLDKKEWPSRWAYAQEFCALTQGRFGVDMSGSSNLDELQHRLRSWGMIRRLKKDVLKELPPKFRQVIELPSEGLDQLIGQEFKAHEKFESILEGLRVALHLSKAAETEGEYHDAVLKLKEGQSAAFREMALLRHDIGVSKIPYIIAHLQECLEAGSKIVCFGWHHDVIDPIFEKFKEISVKLTGDTSMNARQDAVDRFRTDPSVLLFCGNMQSAGVGITLTASHHVTFAESDWVPATISQAEDRCHRIGTTADNVLVQHLVLEGSLDAVMARRIIEKQKVIDQALNTQGEAPPLEHYEIAVEKEDSVVSHITRKEIIQCAILTPQQIETIHAAIRAVSALCDGAHAKDMQGFNLLDARVGHSLANSLRLSQKQAALSFKLAWKYSKQIPEFAEQLKAIKEGA